MELNYEELQKEIIKQCTGDIHSESNNINPVGSEPQEHIKNYLDNNIATLLVNSLCYIAQNEAFTAVINNINLRASLGEEIKPETFIEAANDYMGTQHENLSQTFKKYGNQQLHQQDHNKE